MHEHPWKVFLIQSHLELHNNLYYSTVSHYSYTFISPALLDRFSFTLGREKAHFIILKLLFCSTNP